MMSDASRPPEQVQSPAADPPVQGVISSRGPGALTLEVRGRLDDDVADQLHGLLRKALLDARLVVLDLHKVESIGPAGVYVIVTSNLAARDDGRRLVIVRPPPHVDAALKLEDGTYGGLAVVSAPTDVTESGTG